MLALGGSVIAGYAPTASSGGWTATGTIKTTTSANVGIGTITPRSRLDVDGAVYGDGFFLKDGTPVSGGGGGTGTVTGSGNAGYITRWGSSTSLSDSAIYQNGSNVGIGSTVPRGKLDVDGKVYATGFVGSGAELTGVTTTESDPVAMAKFGTLTNTKWCTSDGTTISCTENTPTGTITAVTGSYPIASSGGATPNITVDLSAYPRKGTLTNGKWCDTDGSVINCTKISLQEQSPVLRHHSR